jgi:signal transduction histidine kinase
MRVRSGTLGDPTVVMTLSAIDDAELGTVLLVDDEPDEREILAAFLEGVPCQVQQVADGESALSEVAKGPPDLILLDLVLPGVAGDEVVRQVRSDPHTATIPIVLVTGLGDRSTRVRSLEAGADEFLTKPVDRAELVTRVRTLLRLKRLRDDHQAEAVQQTEALSATERSRLEGQLRQAQKMEAIGRLAGGVAHDFNNLLTAINGYSEMLLADLASDDPRRAHVEEIARAGERGAELTQQLRIFSRKEVVTPEVLDLNAVVSDTERLLCRLIGEDVRLTTLLTQDLWRIRADPGQLQQVLLNLAVNARDAMPQGGQILIETANLTLDAPTPHTYGTAPPGDYVMVAVSDTGCGMDDETLSHIFEPFFTTKEANKGTGLGLSTVYGIVQQSEGHIWVGSELGHGTVFRIYLPRATDAATTPIPPPAPAVVGRGTETVLLVEDDEQVRGLMATALQASGYTVLEASQGDEAVQLAARHGGPIHLLVTDVVLPGLGGREVARAVAAHHQDLAVLYVSGYTDHAALQQDLPGWDSALLQKPFTPLALARKVRQGLDARQARSQSPTLARPTATSARWRPSTAKVPATAICATRVVATGGRKA